MADYTSADLHYQVPRQDPGDQPKTFEDSLQIESEEKVSFKQEVEHEARKYTANPEPAELPPGFYLEKENLMWCELHKDTRKQKASVFVCSKLDVVAITRDKEGNNHGRLLEFADSDGNVKCWTLPMEMLAGDGTLYRAHLLSMGLKINSHKAAHALLSTYLNHAVPKVRVTSVNRIGWHGERFVLPGCTFGKEGGERLLLQETGHACTSYTTSGGLHEWREHVARYCVQNPRLIFAPTFPRSFYGIPYIALVTEPRQASIFLVHLFKLDTISIVVWRVSSHILTIDIPENI